MKVTDGRLSVLLLCLLNTAGCSQIKSYFPDKEKDYQLTTEIAPLQLPPDLQDSAIVNKPLLAEPQYRPQAPAYQADSREDDAPKPETAQAKYIPVELVDYDGGATRLRIEEPMIRAWRYVGKALTRHSIEIVSRKESEHVYVVLYDPDARKVEDGALWDELVFFFGDDPAQEKEFRIVMAEKNARMTEVIIMDKNDRPRSEGAARQLLNLLKNTINEDLSNREQ